MANLRSIIYDTIEMFNAYSADVDLSEEHIAFRFQNKRNTYLKNYLSNLEKPIPQQAKMQICMSLVEDELCEDDFIFLKSTQKLPTTLEISGRTNIAEAYLNSRSSKWINIVSYNRWPYIKSGGRFNNNQIYITVDPDDYVLVYSPSGNHELLEDLKLNIVPENPEECYKLICNEDNTICDFWDYDYYPIPGDLISPIQNEIVNELLLKYKVPTDIINNAEDDTVNKNRLDGQRQPSTKA